MCVCVKHNRSPHNAAGSIRKIHAVDPCRKEYLVIKSFPKMHIYPCGLPRLEQQKVHFICRSTNCVRPTTECMGSLRSTKLV
eukprot:22554_5